jgi:2-keto-4-pentenoate hydratase
MSNQQMKSEQAAKLIWNCWKNGTTIQNLPDGLRPQSREQGYAIQAHYENFSGQSIFGWKIAATSLAGQKHIGVSGPLAGRLLQERVFQSNSKLIFGKNKMKVAEPEFAFHMGETIKPRYTVYDQAEVMSAVDTLHAAIELPDSRFGNFLLVGEEQLIADNACANELVIGLEMPDLWRTLDLSIHEVTITILGGKTNIGLGANVLGDPRIALTWLANELSKNNISLNAGTTVTTGTCAIPIEINQGDSIIADYGVLGQLQMSLD